MKQKKIINKLVRDKIPDMISANNQEGEYYQYPTDDFENELIVKLGEETGEYLQSKNPEELADILEVFLELLKVRKLSLSDIEELRLKKLAERGGFTNRIFLVKVEESEKAEVKDKKNNHSSDDVNYSC